MIISISEPCDIRVESANNVDSPYRIALVSNHVESIVRFRGPLIRELFRQGVVVYALAPNYTVAEEETVRQMGAIPIPYKLDRTGVNCYRDICTAVALWWTLRCLRLDSVLTFSIKPVIFGTSAAQLAGIKRRIALIEGVGYVFTEDGKRRTLRRKILERLVSSLYRFSLRCATTTLFLNMDDRIEFISRGLVSDSHSECIGGIGVDLNEWLWVPPPCGPITFVLVARLLREKGISEYLRAASIIKHRHPRVRFLILGGRDSNPGAFPEREMRWYVNQGIIEWPGRVNVHDWLPLCSVFVLPSYREGLPLSTQEAMAVGRAVITTDVPGCRDTVQDGDNGFLVPPRDVPALVDAMQRFIDNPSLVETMGWKSRCIAERRFDARTVNARFVRHLLPARRAA